VNERIKELIQMADLCAAGLMASGATEEEIQNRSKVVLANLIVQECIDCVRGAGLADNVAVRNSLGFNDGIAEGVVHIQKNFGVE
jgi:hypothetical protein